MSENLRYWLWLQKALGEGAYIKNIIDDFSSVKSLYEANIIEWKMSSALTQKHINRLETTDINCADEIIYSCQKNNWQIIDYDDERYPQRLKNIFNPPCVIYVDGELPDIDNLVTIGVVGTRKASEYAVKATHLMSRGITECGAVVVSGGALGVDTAAHKGALSAGGKTVAVLGCGLGSSYLNENKQLRNEIKSNGALVTAYPPFTRASKTTFPLRNRIISGLSLGVLVVEAGVKSGSLITANFANEQGRDVFAIPASVLSEKFAGTNKLINDGAMVATDPAHIISVYAQRFDSVDLSKARTMTQLMSDESERGANLKPAVQDKLSFENLEKGRKKRLKKENKARELKGDVKAVYATLGECFVHIDDIISATGLTASQVSSALIQLEVLELAESATGKRFKLS